MSRKLDEKDYILTIDCKLEGEEWQKFIDKAKQSLLANVVVPGYRKGKAPLRESLKRISEFEILDKASQNSINYIYKEHILPQISDDDMVFNRLDNSLEITDLSKNNITMKVSFILYPKATVGNYKELKQKLEKFEPNKEDIKYFEKEAISKYIVMLEVDENEKIKNDDEVNFDFSGLVDGKPFDGGSSENYDLVIGSKKFIAGFEDEMIGLKKGESKDINLKFPNDYHVPNLAGKPVTFKVKINSIKRPSYPEINEQFIKEINIPGIKNIENYNKNIFYNALESNIENAKNTFISKLINPLRKISKVKIHPEILKDEINRMYKNFQDELKKQNITEIEYFDTIDMTKDDLMNQFEKEALKNLEFSFILGTIAEKEKINPTLKEYEKEIDKFQEKFKFLDREQIKQYFSFDKFANTQTDLRVKSKLIELIDPEGYNLLKEKTDEVEKFRTKIEKIVEKDWKELEESQNKLTEEKVNSSNDNKKETTKKTKTSDSKPKEKTASTTKPKK